MARRALPLLLLLLLAGRGAGEGDESALKRVPEELQNRIDTAILKGAKALRGMQNRSGLFPYSRGPGMSRLRTHHEGTTALALLALVHSGVPRDDEAIERGVRWLLDYGSAYKSYVYATGLVIWLLREVDEDLHRPVIRNLAARLAHGTSSKGYWGYHSSRLSATTRDLPNMSTTQYAVLGLWEAHKAGIELPRSTWEKLARTLRNRQQASGGWSYAPSGGSTTFTSSAIGVTCLVIAHAAAARTPAERRAILASREVRLALAKLGDSFDAVMRSRWAGAGVDYYGLYAAERAGIVTESRRFGRRDWYVEGAKRLLAHQNEDGSWGKNATSVYSPTVSTAFALLFLTRATRPVVTPREPLTAEGSGGVDVEKAKALPEKDFRDLVDALLGELAGGSTPAGALGKLEALAPRVHAVLVERLAHSKLATRKAAITALRAMTGRTRGFEASADEADRAAAVKRWKDWLR